MKVPISGGPNESTISTFHNVRQNPATRMSIRRLVRLTNAFSKTLGKHRAAITLDFANYNFCRIDGSLRVTPAIRAGVADRVWKISELFGIRWGREN